MMLDLLEKLNGVGNKFVAHDYGIGGGGIKGRAGKEFVAPSLHDDFVHDAIDFLEFQDFAGEKGGVHSQNIKSNFFALSGSRVIRKDPHQGEAGGDGGAESREPKSKNIVRFDLG